VEVLSKENKIAILTGDFNINLSERKQDAEAKDFLDVIKSNSFFPTFDKPTNNTNRQYFHQYIQVLRAIGKYFSRYK